MNRPEPVRRYSAAPHMVGDTVRNLDRCYDYRWRPLLPGERPFAPVRDELAGPHDEQERALDGWIDILLDNLTPHHKRHG